jgi:hypothetical protein
MHGLICPRQLLLSVIRSTLLEFLTGALDIIYHHRCVLLLSAAAGHSKGQCSTVAAAYLMLQLQLSLHCAVIATACVVVHSTSIRS